MNTTDHGGPAFPLPPEIWGAHFDDPASYPGMSLRDYFAAAEQLTEWDHPECVASIPMCEALAGRKIPEHGWSAHTPEEWLAHLRWEADWRAALRYLRADAMLRARERTEGGAP